MFNFALFLLFFSFQATDKLQVSSPFLLPFIVVLQTWWLTIETGCDERGKVKMWNDSVNWIWPETHEVSRKVLTGFFFKEL